METLGPYQLIRKLATGGMAEVWLAKDDPSSDKLVVVKRILPHLAANQEFVRMFLDEARVAARLNHPNIAQVYDLGHEAGDYYIVMDFIHGADLRRTLKQALLEGRDFPLPMACRVAMVVCDGLHYAHSAKDPTTGRELHIVHRDVSPQNIVVTFEGGVKIVDFGIAKVADQLNQTRSGVLKGKYAYMSPEQAEGKRLDARSDVFALGIVLWELATGERLFKRPTESATLSAVLQCDVPPPSSLNPFIPPSFDQLCLRALRREARDRTPSCRHLRADLKRLFEEQHWLVSSAQLSELMREIFAGQLAEERRLGSVVAPIQHSGPPEDEEPVDVSTGDTQDHLPSDYSGEERSLSWGELQSTIEVPETTGALMEATSSEALPPVVPSVLDGGAEGPRTRTLLFRDPDAKPEPFMPSLMPRPALEPSLPLPPPPKARAARKAAQGRPRQSFAGAVAGLLGAAALGAAGAMIWRLTTGGMEVQSSSGGTARPSTEGEVKSRRGNPAGEEGALQSRNGGSARLNRRATAQPAGGVLILTGEKACQVYDGQKRLGPTRSRLSGIGAGRRVLTVRCDGREQHLSVQVPQRGTVTVRADLPTP